MARSVPPHQPRVGGAPFDADDAAARDAADPSGTADPSGISDISGTGTDASTPWDADLPFPTSSPTGMGSSAVGRGSRGRTPPQTGARLTGCWRRSTG